MDLRKRWIHHSSHNAGHESGSGLVPSRPRISEESSSSSSLSSVSVVLGSCSELLSSADLSSNKTEMETRRRENRQPTKLADQHNHRPP